MCLSGGKSTFLFLWFILILLVNISKVLLVIASTSCLIEVSGINASLAAGEASQAMIISKDGFNFDNFNDKSLIIPAITDKELGDFTHTRDPKVWKYKDNYYMIIGSKVKKEDKEKYTGKVLYYKSKDAKTWEYINSFELHGLGDMWECPDIFTVDGSSVLTMSPENYFTDGTHPTNNAVFGIVDFEEETCNTKFEKDDFRLVDLGRDYYAPQSFVDKEGRRVQIGWIRMNKPFENHTWLGMMSF